MYISTLSPVGPTQSRLLPVSRLQAFGELPTLVKRVAPFLHKLKDQEAVSDQETLCGSRESPGPKVFWPYFLMP